MITTLTNLDEALFSLINQSWSNAFFDLLLPIVRNKLVWIPLYIFIFSFLLLNFGKKGLVIVIFAVGAIAFTDTSSSKVVKPWVKRERPCQNQAFKEQVRLLVHCGGGYSFTSSHATNHFGLAVFLFLALNNLIGRRKLLWLLPLWALLICYAQIYVGVHYPSDVFFGALLGTGIGWLLTVVCLKRIHFIKEN